MILLFLKSIILGISIAMPVGPISTLAIKNCLTRGFKIGFATSFGASITEGFYGFVATGGLAFISKFLTSYISEVKLISGTALIMLALYEIKTARNFSFEEIKTNSRGFFQTMFLATFLTLGSPVTIVLFIGVFATMTGTVLTPEQMAVTVFGIFTGSVIWAFILCGTVSKIRHKLSKDWMAWIKIIAAVVIGSFGIYGICSVIFR
ncbi:MAG: LysE family translocator [Proteobacteria bacterium]|nr:LysE family translocator [Pseudomonadota bacterium]